MRWIIAAALLATGLAGCADDTGDATLEEEALGSDANATLAAGEVALRGLVHDEAGRPIPGAVVRALGTGTDPVETPREGTFSFTELPEGPLEVHVEAPGYAPAHASVTIVAGRTVDLDVLMRELVGVNPDARAHLHDYWGGLESIVLMDEEVDPLERPPNGAVRPELHRAYWTVCHPSLGDSCPFVATHYPILLPESTPGNPILIFPGTERIEVTLDWSAPDQTVERMGVSYRAPDQDEDTVLGGDVAGTTWTIPVNRFQADAGHSSWTSWDFYFYPDNDPAAAGPAWRPAVATGPVDVKIEVFRGTEPFLEPAHPEFWVNGTELLVVDATKSAALSLGSPATWDSYVTKPLDGALLAPGTSRVAITLTWTSTATDPLGGMALLWRTADMNPHTTSVGDMVTVPGTSCGERCILYEFEPDPLTLDRYYQSQSAWRFFAHPDWRDWNEPWYIPDLEYSVQATIYKD